METPVPERLDVSVDESIRSRLLELRRRDQTMRKRLAEDGSLFDGYHPEMERVHVENATQLSEILERVGWPDEVIAGAEGVEAAWLVAQHAISLPAFQRRCLALLREAVERRRAPARQAALLTDRVRFNERRPQIYGTIFDWDAEGRMSPWRVEQPEDVERLRESVGLPPLEAEIERVRSAAEREGQQPPPDFEGRQRQILEWARGCGWIP